MFTVKFYDDREGKARILSADFITIRSESPYLKGITLHRANGDDEILWAGTRTADTAFIDEHRVYTRAIIENAAGKTTEFVQAPPVPPIPSTQQNGIPSPELLAA